MVMEDDNVPNWTLDNTGVLSQKVAKKFYFSNIECVDWVSLVWLDKVSPAKNLIIWKLLYGHLSIDLEVKKKMSGFML